MCYRYSLVAQPAELERLFEASFPGDLAPRYNIAPTQDVWIVREPRAGAPREALASHWGLVPSWTQDPAGQAALLANARSETVAQKPAFRDSYRQRRCLIPATSFYEWKASADGRRHPFLFQLKSRAPFAFAGLWDTWQDHSGKMLTSCVILTTEPNDLLRQIHDRMPVILSPEHYDVWLDPEINEAGALHYFLQPLAASAMSMQAVSLHVNDVHHEGPDCHAPPGDAAASPDPPALHPPPHHHPHAHSPRPRGADGGQLTLGL